MNVGIVGAGTMGRGVAQVAAENGHLVQLIDISSEALKNAENEIYNLCRFRNFQAHDGPVKPPDAVLSRIAFHTDIDALSDADYVVENVVENIQIKEKVYRQADSICGKSVIFAANTSCISITKLASYTNRREQVIGIHFMNPVPMIPAVEVIKGFHTSQETVVHTKGFLKSLNKEGIVIHDFPGFVSNRISHLMMNEAAFIVQDHCATPEDVDSIFRNCYGHKMGPLETADLIGLDTVKDSLEVLYDSYHDPKFRCCPLLAKMVDAGLLGRKSGEGFYKYDY